ncbi:Gfo/Idh/MocA family protein [Flavisolibacter ginsenosidimutans]|uniref:Gfo/Idh/MocA family oxidoreductase n=1 Tax=Flavisolibacter ginsenosidimutans TaxID=661481 RepID=A0A5B8UJV6_9BACT|nr:Gfo/Idh/MocA family oxidoreductase [Flavisolibacter ginsenosidimutans]QEC56954.1 Gfo/Idh/MocA family oxidoreductase [Flavisolibacter ginsenosidimutans]
MKDGKLGIALVGLGSYSEGQLAPALQQTKHCYLAGIVTGSSDKAAQWKTKYNLPANACYTYETFDRIKEDSNVDIVYVVLPNALHAEYVVRAAQAGKHVICEKPMAVTVEECDRMIAACKEAGKMLSVGYRLHFEPHNKEAMRIGQQKVFGDVKWIEAEHGLSEATGWRLKKALAGGGPLMDVGIYCVQAARYLTGLEPVAVTAQEGFKHHPEKFNGIEESITWQMEMPDGIVAKCTSSYSEKQNRLLVEAERGWLELSPAYSYAGIEGRTAEGKMDFAQVNQQALQMDDFALCVKEGKPSPVSGEEGRQDVKILQAIYRAMHTGERAVIE